MRRACPWLFCVLVACAGPSRGAADDESTGVTGTGEDGGEVVCEFPSAASSWAVEPEESEACAGTSFECQVIDLGWSDATSQYVVFDCGNGCEPTATMRDAGDSDVALEPGQTVQLETIGEVDTHSNGWQRFVVRDEIDDHLIFAVFAGSRGSYSSPYEGADIDPLEFSGGGPICAQAEPCDDVPIHLRVSVAGGDPVDISPEDVHLTIDGYDIWMGERYSYDPTCCDLCHESDTDVFGFVVFGP